MLKKGLFNLLTVSTVGTSSIAAGTYYTSQTLSIDINVPLMSIGTTKGEIIGEFIDARQLLDIKVSTFRDVVTQAGSISNAPGIIENEGSIKNQGSNEMPGVSEKLGETTGALNKEEDQDSGNGNEVRSKEEGAEGDESDFVEEIDDQEDQEQQEESAEAAKVEEDLEKQNQEDKTLAEEEVLPDEAVAKGSEVLEEVQEERAPVDPAPEEPAPEEPEPEAEAEAEEEDNSAEDKNKEPSDDSTKTIEEPAAEEADPLKTQDAAEDKDIKPVQDDTEHQQTAQEEEVVKNLLSTSETQTDLQTTDDGDSDEVNDLTPPDTSVTGSEGEESGHLENEPTTENLSAPPPTAPEVTVKADQQPNIPPAIKETTTETNQTTKKEEVKKEEKSSDAAEAVEKKEAIKMPPADEPEVEETEVDEEEESEEDYLDDEEIDLPKNEGLKVVLTRLTSAVIKNASILKGK